MNARVSVIGAGAIGGSVIEALAAGQVDGADLVAIVANVPVPDGPAPQVRLDEAIERSDIVIECASQIVVAQHGADVLNRGRDLLVTSVGALADAEVAARVRLAGPGRLLLTAGAVGGVDLLASAANHGRMRRASVTTTKLPITLLQPWMDDAAEDRLRNTNVPIEVFRGNAVDAARFFPRSLNVAATVGFAIGDLELVEVTLIADPDAELSSHVIEAEGEAGSYRFDIRNRPSPGNPRSSGIVPQAILRSLSVLVGRPVEII